MDLIVPSDILRLFNFKCYVLKDGRKTFRYIFFDNYDYLLDNGKLCDIAFDNTQKTILYSSIYLDYDFFERPQCRT